MSDELAELEAGLGPFGFQWLCACAIFPVLRFPLTVHLGARLAEIVDRGRPPDAEEHRAIFQLPWFRQGWLPPDLRARVVASIDPGLARALRSEIERLLRAWRFGRDGPAGDLAVRLAGDAAPVRDRSLRTLAGGDRILAAFVLGIPPPERGLALGSWLARELRLRLAPIRGGEVLWAALIAACGLAAAALIAFEVVSPSWFDTQGRQLVQFARPRPARETPVAPSGPAPGARSPNPRPGTPTAAETAAVPALADSGSRTGMFLPGGGQGAGVPPPKPDGPEQWAPLSEIKSGIVWQVKFSHDGKTLFSKDALYDAANTTELISIAKQTGFSEIYGADFAPDDQRIAIGGLKGVAFIYDLSTHEKIPLPGPQGDVNDIHFSSDGSRILGADQSGVAFVWDVKSGRVLNKIAGIGDEFYSVAFSPDGAHFASASSAGVGVWDVASGKMLRKLSSEVAWSVIYSPDGTKIVAGEYSGKGLCWNVATGEQLFTVDPPNRSGSNMIHGLAFSPDGSRFATASWRDGGHVWDAATGRHLATLDSEMGDMESTAFSSNGGLIATGSDSGAAIWSLIVTLSPDGKAADPRSAPSVPAPAGSRPGLD